MNIFAAVKALYPSADDDDFELRDDSDGAGPYLALWNEAKLGPAPTADAIRNEAAKLPAPEPEPAPREKPVLVPTTPTLRRRAVVEAETVLTRAAAALAGAESVRLAQQRVLDRWRSRPAEVAAEIAATATLADTHPGKPLSLLTNRRLTDEQQAMVEDYLILVDRGAVLTQFAAKVDAENAEAEARLVVLNEAVSVASGPHADAVAAVAAARALLS